MKTSELKLDFTGDGCLIINLKKYGPMQIRWEKDMDFTLKLISLIVKDMATWEVGAYNAREQKQLETLVRPKKIKAKKSIKKK